MHHFTKEYSTPRPASDRLLSVRVETPCINLKATVSRGRAIDGYWQPNDSAVQNGAVGCPSDLCQTDQAPAVTPLCVLRRISHPKHRNDVVTTNPDDRAHTSNISVEFDTILHRRCNRLPTDITMPDPLSTPMRYENYTVAVICTINFEMSAVRFMLDREHPRLPPKQGDSNLYVLGELSGHNVVVAYLPGIQGKGAAATVATNLARTFPSVEWRFLVGIGGGVPSDKHDIRLGDVVISMPDGQYGGVVQYDLGKDTEDNFQLKGFLLPPPAMLRGAVELMQSDHLMADNKVEEFLVQMLRKRSRLSIYQRPLTEHDVLFHADYPHVGSGSTCEHCDKTKTIRRSPRQFSGPEVHYGLVASGDRVMRSATKRNASTGSLGDILCFEMEAAGIATEFPCIVIRGISDYADSHKNDAWQHYAAAAAAASAKELLSYISVSITPELPVGDATLASPDQGAPPSGNGSFSQQFSGQGIQSSGPLSFEGGVHFGEK